MGLLWWRYYGGGPYAYAGGPYAHGGGGYFASSPWVTMTAVILTAIPAILIIRKIGMALAAAVTPTKPQSAELCGVRIWAIDRAPGSLFEGDDDLMLRCQ
jgi:hypothetical protein